MKKLPHTIALLLFIVAAGIWASSGFHTGWTQTSIPVTGIDEITGIEYTHYKKGFIAGIEFLAGGLAVAVAISASTLFIQYLLARKIETAKAR